MYKITLIRHGESEWNKESLFTGWTDVPLSEKGIQEAMKAGKKLKENKFEFDLAFTSYLRRALHTLWIVADVLDELWIPWEKSWRLNERHYGALQGLNKKEMAEKHGKKQVHEWRRGYSTNPPLLEKNDKRFPGNQRMYNSLHESELPLGESLEDTYKRFIPYWNKSIVPEIKKDKQIIISAHGNSLRALIKHLENISDEEISSVEIPTGKPLIYELNNNLRATNKYYL
ncbi:MAG TPA: 2,3-diphosphoglycerate-dependent phosphoglycerate mutase [Bacteroidales bacterium]|nr:2,3-diphosphoglycerate-dependent phosphoglycerate mutase [Bacteroidales bacterium]